MSRRSSRLSAKRTVDLDESQNETRTDQSADSGHSKTEGTEKPAEASKRCSRRHRRPQAKATTIVNESCELSGQSDNEIEFVNTSKSEREHFSHDENVDSDENEQDDSILAGSVPTSETPEPPYEPPTEPKDVIRQYWEVPAVAHFCSLFRDIFNLVQDYDIEDLEEALVIDSVGGTVRSTLIVDLVISLLKGITNRKDITLVSGVSGILTPGSLLSYNQILWDMLEYRWSLFGLGPNPLGTDRETASFHSLPIGAKVMLLQIFCDWRLDKPDVETLTKNFASDSLRVLSLGRDDSGHVYWYFYGVRLYKEAPEPVKITIQPPHTEQHSEDTISAEPKSSKAGKKGKGKSTRKKSKSRKRKLSAVDDVETEDPTPDPSQFLCAPVSWQRHLERSQLGANSPNVSSSQTTPAKPRKRSNHPFASKKKKKVPNKGGATDISRASSMQREGSFLDDGLSTRASSVSRDEAMRNGSVSGTDSRPASRMPENDSFAVSLGEPEGTEANKSSLADLVKNIYRGDADDSDAFTNGATPKIEREASAGAVKREAECDSNQEAQSDMKQEAICEDSKPQTAPETSEEHTHARDTTAADADADEKPPLETPKAQETPADITQKPWEQEKVREKTEHERRGSERLEKQRLEKQLEDEQRQLREQEEIERRAQAREESKRKAEAAMRERRAKQRERDKERQDRLKLRASEERSRRLELRKQRAAYVDSGLSVPDELLQATNDEFDDLGVESDEDVEAEFERMYDMLEKVLDRVQNVEDAHPFMQPVTNEEAPGYEDLIKEPMDLSTLETKLLERDFKNKFEFIEDMNKIFLNCLKFNGPNHEITRTALRLERSFIKSWQRYFPASEARHSGRAQREALACIEMLGILEREVNQMTRGAATGGRDRKKRSQHGSQSPSLPSGGTQRKRARPNYVDDVDYVPDDQGGNFNGGGGKSSLRLGDKKQSSGVGAYKPYIDRTDLSSAQDTHRPIGSSNAFNASSAQSNSSLHSDNSEVCARTRSDFHSLVNVHRVRKTYTSKQRLPQTRPPPQQPTTFMNAPIRAPARTRPAARPPAIAQPDKQVYMARGPDNLERLFSFIDANGRPAAKHLVDQIWPQIKRDITNFLPRRITTIKLESRDESERQGTSSTTQHTPSQDLAPMPMPVATPAAPQLPRQDQLSPFAPQGLGQMSVQQPSGVQISQQYVGGAYIQPPRPVAFEPEPQATMEQLVQQLLAMPSDLPGNQLYNLNGQDSILVYNDGVYLVQPSRVKPGEFTVLERLDQRSLAARIGELKRKRAQSTQSPSISSPNHSTSSRVHLAYGSPPLVSTLTGDRLQAPLVQMAGAGALNTSGSGAARIVRVQPAAAARMNLTPVVATAGGSKQPRTVVVGSPAKSSAGATAFNSQSYPAVVVHQGILQCLGLPQGRVLPTQSQQQAQCSVDAQQNPMGCAKPVGRVAPSPRTVAAENVIRPQLGQVRGRANDGNTVVIQGPNSSVQQVFVVSASGSSVSPITPAVTMAGTPTSSRSADAAVRPGYQLQPVRSPTELYCNPLQQQQQQQERQLAGDAQGHRIGQLHPDAAQQQRQQVVVEVNQRRATTRITVSEPFL